METLHFETLWTAGGLALLASYLFFIGVFIAAVRVNHFRRRLDKALEDAYPWRQEKGRPWKFYTATLVLSCVGFNPYFPNIVIPIVLSIAAVWFLLWCATTWPTSEGTGGMREHFLLPWLMIILSFYATALNCELTALLRYGDEWMSHVASGLGIRVIIHGASAIFGILVLLAYSIKINDEESYGFFRLRHVVFLPHKKLVRKIVEERFPKARKNKSETT